MNGNSRQSHSKPKIDHAFHWIELPVLFFIAGSLLDLMFAVGHMTEPTWFLPVITGLLGYIISFGCFLVCPKLDAPD